MATSLITGITGQTGSYMAEYLLERGDTVHGIIRRSSSINTGRIDHIYNHPMLKLHYGDVTDIQSLMRIVLLHKPDVIYHLAAMSHVGTSFELPDQCIQVNALGTLRLLEAVRTVQMQDTEYSPRIYLAGTSEEFGNSAQFQDETTPLDPRSPYGVSKEMSYHLGKLYREAYNMHIVIGHCFNHESPRRDIRFVTRKVTNAVARYIKHADGFEPVKLGNLDAQRDWTHARDMVRGIVAMTENTIKPVDYVLASGKARSIRELVEVAFSMRNVRVKWCSNGVNERGICCDTARVLVEVDAKYFRPSEVDHLCGNATKAQQDLGWEPTISFEDMIEEMISVDE